MPITLNHSNIGVQYSTGSNYIIETVKSDLYRKNEIVDTIVRDNIQVAPVTPIISIQDGSNVYAVESYTYSGSGNTADFTRVFTKSTTCDILIVGGGGGGGTDCGGGGGGGGVIYAKNVSISANTYTIKVGKGGAGMENGISSEAFGATANGGGSGGGGFRVSTTLSNNGGSGGGGGLLNSLATRNGGGAGTNTIGSTLSLGNVNNYNGNVGGTCPGRLNGDGYGLAGGGGGAGSVGIEGINSTTTGLSNTFNNGKGKGGDGVPINITGQTYYWAAGGGGGTVHPILPGAGGRGGGGGGSQGFDSVDNPVEIYGGAGGLDGIQSAIAPTNTSVAEAGFGGHGAPNTGSGGGGGGYYYNKTGGSGGSGIVIIRYLLGTIPSNNLLTTEPTVSFPTFTETIRTFTHSGGTEAQTTHTITVGQNTICDILIVGGGGGGGNGDGSSNEPGGGGAGGIVYMINKTLNAGTYKINVGKGGASNTNGNNSTITYSNDNNITFDNIQLIGRGGGKGATTASQTGSDGGSGGGGGHDRTNGGLATQGNTFWNGTSYVAGGYNGGKATAGGRGGGGGGAGEVGSTDGDGYGGDGVQVNITGTNTFYAGGGNAFPNRTTTQSDGGGGLVPATGNPINGGNALPNTGSGGAGAYGGAGGVGGSGGSGIVIIKFKSIVGAGILDNTTHKRLNFAYTPNYPYIQADNTNLKAWYKFDGNYNDSSPSGFNLTNSGATIVDGLIVQSLSTDASDFLETSGINLNGKTYSISFWLKFNTTPGTGNIPLFTQGITDSTSTRLIFLYENGNKLRFSHYGSGNDIDTAGYNISSMVGTSWHHYVITYNNTNRGAEIWLDGIKLNTNISTLANTFTGSGSFTIARWQGTTFNGLMEDFRYYDKILTSTEISQLYSIPTTNQYTLNFPVPTLADINNNSNIILRGAYDIALSTSNYVIIPKTGQYIPNPTTFTNYSIERIYPPIRNFTAATTTVSGQSYGNGTYVVSYSSSQYAGLEPWTCFNTSKIDGGHWGENRYTSGVFNNTSFIVQGYLGDWIKIQLPVAIKLTKFGFLMRYIIAGAPKDFKIYGSNDNITWVELVNKTDTVYNASNMYEQTTPEITNTYIYYGLVVNKLFSTSGVTLYFDEWYIYGQELFPSPLSIRYNILNPILDPIGAQWTYNTSNTNVYHMGRVGIGTTSPEYQIDVSGTLNAKAYYFNGVQIGRLSEGMVANVQHLTYTHMEIKNNTGWDAINDDLTTGFVISITPKSNLSKILVNLIAHIGLTNANDGRWWGIKLYRKIGTAAWAEVTGPNGTETGSAANTNGTPVWISHNMGTTTANYPYHIINLTGTYLDSPNTTSTVYYTAYWNQRMGDNPSATGNLWLNRAANQNDAYRPAPSSSWTLKEIWYG